MRIPFLQSPHAQRHSKRPDRDTSTWISNVLWQSSSRWIFATKHFNKKLHSWNNFKARNKSTQEKKKKSQKDKDWKTGNWKSLASTWIPLKRQFYYSCCLHKLLSLHSYVTAQINLFVGDGCLLLNYNKSLSHKQKGKITILWCTSLGEMAISWWGRVSAALTASLLWRTGYSL